MRTQWLQVEECPVCSSPVFAELVPPHVKPRIRFSCRCPVVHPERFKDPGKLGYRIRRVKGARRS